MHYLRGMKELRLEGVIGDFNNTSEEVVQRIAELQLAPDEDLRLVIHSPGGSVFEGFAIYNHLVSLPNPITAKVEGLCGSIATLIALAANRVEMSQVALWMVHRASTMAMGNTAELEEQIDVLKIIDRTLVNVYASRTGKPVEEIEAIIDKDTFYDSDAALAFGWIDEIVDKVDAKMAAKFKSLNTINMSKLTDLYAKFRGEGTDPAAPAAAAPAAPAAEPEAAVDPMTVEELAITVEAMGQTVEQLRVLVEELIAGLAEEAAPAAPAEEAKIEEIVEARFTALVKNLDKTAGKVPAGNGGLSGSEADKYVPKWAAFKAKMAEIDARTRVKS